MKEYVSPNAELIEFSGSRITAAVSGCNCHFDITGNTMMINGKQPECEFGISGHASENPFGVAAPDWTFG